ncbi:MAG: hypothetical protein A3I29_02255 [Candidatus Magasanikbacteria bacterium RIFCSPLOWO2_02_FULL_44_11]|uniref:Uncharacterized protein n=2 Tax=Candidatus Magasanikiibacteriota TaxID=1752731 RepID=A0A1F6NAC7_9BACT|nr:MAG: hypothetical protein A3D53_01310 [Candidatus Magasanikbacteria bacterium RIFCSPHIGHO2_02_FULL_45_10]OGH80876.1 MAG: hypothetical protein A3I29_02255 [Candidatus Magasanikbacteria bacterium RIFCSPLOWO2_02_FULL_44_11]
MVGDPMLETSAAKFSNEQKIGLGLLLIFAVVSISLGVLQIRNRLYKPFALNNSVPAGLQEEVNTIEALRFRDTDFDGLNDFDELYLHSTSPYLADTDSDGLSDQAEIATGSNPLCAKDKLCETADQSAEMAAVIPSSTFGLEEESPVNLDDYISNPVYIRQLLIQNGVKKDIIDKMTDQQIVAMMQQVLQSTTTPSAR